MEPLTDYAKEMGLFTTDNDGRCVMRGLTVEETAWYFNYVRSRSMPSEKERNRFISLDDRHERARSEVMVAEMELRGNPTIN